MSKLNPILRLTEYDRNSKRISTIEILKEIISDLENPEYEYNFNKAVVLLLDETGSSYRIRYGLAGMHRSEVVSLLEVAKLRFLRGLTEGSF